MTAETVYPMGKLFFLKLEQDQTHGDSTCRFDIDGEQSMGNMKTTEKNSDLQTLGFDT